VRVVAIFCGGDWNDASCEHLNLPAEVDLEEQKRSYNKWYEEEFCHPVIKPKYFTFTQWLIRFAGAAKAINVEEFYT
jgi:hypothetical protein